MVIALIERARFRREVASGHGIQEREGEVGSLAVAALDAPRERQASPGAGGGVELVAATYARLLAWSGVLLGFALLLRRSSHLDAADPQQIDEHD